MALTEKVSPQQPASGAQPLPSAFPSLPEDALQRFPSLVSYQSAVDTFFRRLRGSLYSMLDSAGSSTSAAIMATRANSRDLEARYGDLQATVTEERTARIDSDAALAATIATLSATAGVTSTVFVQSGTPTANAVNDIWFKTSEGFKPYTWTGTAWSDLTDTRLTGTISALSTESTARASADSALSTSIASVLAIANANASSISTITSTYATTAYTTAAIATALSSATGYTDAAITSESGTRASADSALSSTLSTLSATVSGNYSTLSSAITSESSTRASADTALSGSITTLSATVSGNYSALTASVTAEASARATADGYLAGQYALQVAAGNVVTGMVLTSATSAGTSISNIIFQTDHLYVKTATGASTTLLDISTAGFVFGADIASDNYVAGSAGWLLTRAGNFEASTGTFRGALAATSGTIGGFTIGPDQLSAGSGLSYVEINNDFTVGITLGNTTSAGIDLINDSSGPVINFRGSSGLPRAFIGTATTSDFGFLELRSSSYPHGLVTITAAAEPQMVFDCALNDESHLYFLENGTGVFSLNYAGAAGSPNNTMVFRADGAGGYSGDLLSINQAGDVTIAGLLKFGTYVAAAHTATGYINIKDSGGTTRRLLVG